MAEDIIYGRRAVGELAYVVRTEDNGHGVLMDPSFSPNVLQMPDVDGVPDELRGQLIRVECSCWLGVAPNPEMDPTDPATEWLDQRTRWHLMEWNSTKSNLAVAEVAGHGWAVTYIGETQANILRKLATDEMP